MNDLQQSEPIGVRDLSDVTPKEKASPPFSDNPCLTEIKGTHGVAQDRGCSGNSSGPPGTSGHHWGELAL